MSLLVAIQPDPSRAAAQPEIEQSVPTPTDEQTLESLVGFLIPAHMLAVTLSQCDQSYRDSLSRNEGMSAIEAELPGIKDYMVGASRTYCASHIPYIYDETRRSMQKRSTECMNPAEVRRIYPLISEASAEMAEPNWARRTDESSGQAVARLVARGLQIADRVREKERLFLLSPENASVATKLRSLQSEAAQKIEQYDAQTYDAMIAAADAGMNAGNELAVQRGQRPIFRP